MQQDALAACAHMITLVQLQVGAANPHHVSLGGKGPNQPVSSRTSPRLPSIPSLQHPTGVLLDVVFRAVVFAVVGGLAAGVDGPVAATFLECHPRAYHCMHMGCSDGWW